MGEARGGELLARVQRVERCGKSSQVTRCLSQGIPLQCETRVTRIEPVECGVAVLCEKGQRLCAEQAIISAPPAQAGWLLERRR